MVYTTAVGFYYGSSQPPDDGGSGGLRETLAIIWVVFRVLALPLGILFGVVLGFAFILWLFSISAFLGLGAIGVVVAAIVARGVWEARHPPDL